MRFEHGRRGVLNFRGGHVAGGEAFGLGQFDQVELRVAVDVHIDGVVVGLGAGGPARTGCRGVGHRGDGAGGLAAGEAAVGVLRHQAVAAVGAQRERGVLAGAGLHGVQVRLADLVKTVERSVDAMQIVAGDRDLGVAHAVSDEKNDVLRRGVAIHARDALRTAVLGQFGDALAILGKSHTGERRHHGERCNRCGSGLQLMFHCVSSHSWNNRRDHQARPGSSARLRGSRSPLRYGRKESCSGSSAVMQRNFR